MTITQEVKNQIIKNLIKGEDYRIEVVALIDAEFLHHTINFFKQIIEAKLANEKINLDWYKKVFLAANLTKEEIAHNSGMNIKSVSNMYKTTRKEKVIEVSLEHYDVVTKAIQELIDNNDNLDLTLTLKFNNVSIDLTINETLIVVNALAVKRAALRGGAWSSVGKRVEKPLMQLLCKLYGVSEVNYNMKFKRKVLKEDEFEREIDFYLKGQHGTEYKCEVKLMGRGNPESADAFFARESKIFIADTLSETNKKQLNAYGVQWVELYTYKGFERFEEVLKNLNIPYQKKFTSDNLSELISLLLSEIQNQTTNL